jgi:hypothetical protein
MYYTLKKTSEVALKKQAENGSFPSGNNGPYNDKETPLRNTAHWGIAFSHLYKKTNQEKYLIGAKKCGNFLLNRRVRPMNATFFCRKNPKKDFSNGLIGQAWAIEGLLEIFKITNINKYIKTALEVFLLHPFNHKLGLWKKVNVDGSYNNFDKALNHQLWFATVGVGLYKYTKEKKIKEELTSFFNHLNSYLTIHYDGLIKHSIKLNYPPTNFIKNQLRNMEKAKTKIIKGRSMRYKENGYQLFNLYALALLKREEIELSLWKSKKFKKILDYTFSEKLFTELMKNNYKKDYTSLNKINNNLNINRYGFAYNAPGFEFPFIYQMFSRNLSGSVKIKPEYVWKKQINLTYDKSINWFSKNTEDSKTLTARIYELTRYLENV